MPQDIEDWEFLIQGENPGEDVLKILRKELNPPLLENRVAASVNSKPMAKGPTLRLELDSMLLVKVGNIRGLYFVLASTPDLPSTT